MSKSLKYRAKRYLESQVYSHSGRWLCRCRDVDNIYLTLNLNGMPLLYLIGGRGHGNKDVYTQKNIDKIDTFLWKHKEVKSV